MIEYMELGPTPSGEDCQQVGTDSYDHAKAKAECRAYLNQLVRMFGEPPSDGYYSIKSFPHDFGSYMEVCICYNEGDYNEETGENEESESMKYAYNVEANLPEYWDAEAKKELGIAVTENELSERSLS